MRKKLSLVLTLLFALVSGSVYAQLSSEKTYTISNNNDANMFMQDNSTGGVALAAKNNNSYWKFVATENTDCYYIQNAATGKYIQGYDASEQEVATGDTGVEYYVTADASGNLEGKYRMSCTANSPHNFSDGTLGLNWKNNNTVQSFASVAGGNPRSAWIVTEEAMPEPEESSTLTSPYTGSELAEGDFFLYNVATGLWIQNNDKNTGDWNTRGATGDYGFAFGIRPADDGNGYTGWRLDPKFGHNHSMNASNFYLDTNDGLTIWSIVPQEVEGVSNAYFIKAGENTLSLNADNNLDWNTGKGDVWQLVTREERLAYMKANATAENPIDATFLIMDPRFVNENERGSNWKWNQDGGNKDDVRWFRNRRSYAIWNSNSFSLTQTIENIPNGYYKLNVKGYYRDGDKDQCATRRTEGTEKKIGKYFINNDKADMMSILDGASESWVEGLFFYPAANDEAPYGHYPDNKDGFNRIFQDYPNSYMNEGVVSIVTTKSAKIGLEKLEKNEKDWIAWDEFYLTYLGPIDVSEYITALNTAIEAAESVDASNTTDALKTALSQALSDAKAALNSEDTDELSSVTTTLNATVDAVKAVNVTVLKQTADLAQAEGIDVTAATTAIAEATTSSQLDQSLYDLRAARKINALRMPDIYTGSAPAEGKVYIFNLGTGLFLGTGSDWNTHAAVDQVGIEIELIADGDNFKMKTNRGGGWLNYGGYVDTGGQDAWHFLPVEGKQNVYNISSTGNDGYLLGYDANGNTDGKHYWSTIAIDRTGLDNPMNQWKVINAAEREQLILNASASQPVDVSYLIKNASLNRQDGYDMWEKQCDGGNGGARVSTVNDNNGDRAADYAWEYFEPNSFSFMQTIEGLRPGNYEVSVQGFFRNGNGDAQVNVVNESGELKQLAYLEANGTTALLPNIASVMSKFPGMTDMRSTNFGEFPNMPQSAIEHFETGYYKTTVSVKVANDGKLTIGVKKDTKELDGDWVVFDNFRLKYLGEEPITSMSIVGDFTGGWPTEEGDWSMAKAMTQNAENTAIWTFEMQDVVIEGKKYEYKATANNQWGRYELPSSGNADWVFGTEQYPAGVYDLVFTVDTENHTLTLVPTLDTIATGITEMNANGNAKIVYNLQGQKMQQTKKGLYIVNGKKTIVK